jgi:hypothetical protein
MGRGKQWQSVEDELLCRSWIVVSEDPITGAGQKAQQFWQKILQYFKQESAPDLPDRNVTALISRWAAIRLDVSKFCGLYGKISAEEHSGWSPDMYIEEAMRLWSLRDPKNGEFNFKSCWLYLKDKRKWLVDIGEVPKNQSVEPAQQNEAAVVTPARPIGQKAAKRKAMTPENTIQHLQHEEFIAVAKRKAQAMEDRLAFTLFAMDPTSAESQQFFAMKRRAILNSIAESNELEEEPSDSDDVAIK